MKTISLNLSDGVIQKHCKQDVILRDTKVPFLSFRYLKSSKHVGSFQITFTCSGKSTSCLLGQYPLLTIKDARVAATAKLQFIEAKKNNATKEKCFDNCGELLDWYKSFRCSDTNISFNTKRNVEHHIQKVLKPILSRQRFEDLNASFMSEVWLKSELVNYQVSTLKSSFQCLKAAFNRAHKLGYIQPNPLDKISFGDISACTIKPRENKIQFWSVPKLVNLINGMPTELRVLSFLCLGYLTRNQETVDAKWEHFDFKNMLWHIPAKNTKTGQGISHPITPQILTLLKQYKKWQLHKTRSKFLFPQKRGYRALSASQAARKIALHTSGKFRLHDLRKFGSTSLRDMGTDYYIVERILNHKMTQLDQTYIQTSSRKIIAESLEKWHQEVLR
ncbi:MAG: tyrosine-type recombinase/integrase [Paraglaciecola sp.]|uniref:tyrosine-type recombinase/integrase n=1 Tax=Paraglaciecola sp. TaxID=1920173 RepID=UPI0032977FBD